MPEFVLNLCTRDRGTLHPEVLFILKDRPEWQKGRLNLPGGKIEAGETPVQAAVRELKEETGLTALLTKSCGVMQDRHLKVYCLYTVNLTDEPLKPRKGETETPMWLEWQDACKDKRLMVNLRVIIPLMLAGVERWIIDDVGGKGYGAGLEHTLKVTVPTYQVG